MNSDFDTRRGWKDRHVQKFIKAFNKDRRYGGQQIGWLKLTQELYQQRLANMPETDVAAEGDSV